MMQAWADYLDKLREGKKPLGVKMSATTSRLYVRRKLTT